MEPYAFVMIPYALQMACDQMMFAHYDMTVVIGFSCFELLLALGLGVGFSLPATLDLGVKGLAYAFVAAAVST